MIPTPTALQTTTADNLDDAADYIEKNGWTQGRLGGVGSPVCLVGSLYVVGVPDPFGGPEYRGLILTINEDYDLSTNSIPTVNDNYFTRCEQAVCALRRAAQRCRGEDPGPLPRSLRIRQYRTRSLLKRIFRR